MTLQQTETLAPLQPDSHCSLKSVVKPQRDLRIDFFRGAALLLIFVDHVEWGVGVEWISGWTLKSLGYCDAAEVFVFISGYVFGIVYGRLQAEQGTFACLRKATWRCLQIYIAYQVTLWSVLLFQSVAEQSDLIWLGRLASRHHGQSTALLLKDGLLLLYQPHAFAILASYILILLVMPLLLGLLRWKPWVAMLVSGGLYAAVQFRPEWNLPALVWWSGNWFFNPLAWQFLFFLGTFAAVRVELECRRIPRNRCLLAGCVLVLVVGVLDVKVRSLLEGGGGVISEWSLQQWRNPFSWTSKTTLAPARLVHFLALAYTATWICGRRATFWSRRFVRPIVVCGQHSLAVFCVGLFLTYLCVAAAFALGSGLLSLAVIEADGCLLLAGTAFWLDAQATRKTIGFTTSPKA